MPGILIMNQNGAQGATRVGDAADHTTTAASPSQAPKSMLNGDRNPSQNDAHGHGHAATPLNGAPASSTGKAEKFSSLFAMPPEIRHITESYIPVSKIIRVVSQECFNDLSETLTRMAEMPLIQQPNGQLTNGLAGHATANGAGPSSSANVRKKQLLLKFAEDQRTKFIKLLVLSQWSRDVEQVGKMIDIVSWAVEQWRAYATATDEMGFIKNDMTSAKLANPDIKTALEVLSTGEDPRIPNLGFISPQPISADRALRVLQNLNTQLCIRLNIHEKLPRHLKNWRVGSGRATFVLSSEFEFDVSTFSEDTSSGWFLTDMRLLFSPAPDIPKDSPFYRALDDTANTYLREAGLSSCFDFLHNFVLTHKIAVLEAQALQLLTANWMRSLMVYNVHRFLCVQYWADVPGKKNWIEIGISSGKPRNGKASWKGPSPSYLTFRWFRQGVEITDAKLDFDCKELSVERMLKTVISHHISHIFHSTRSRLLTSIQGRSMLHVTVQASDSEPSDCTFEASLGDSQTRTTVLIDPITGKFALRPCNSASYRHENEMNRAATTDDVSLRVSSLLCSTLSDTIVACAQQLGWSNVHGLDLRPESNRDAFMPRVSLAQVFRPLGWSSTWALAAFISASGESWWIIGLRQVPTGSPAIVSAEEIQMKHKRPISRSLLSSIECAAVSKISFKATAQELDARHVPYRGPRLVTSSTSTVPSASTRSFQQGLHGYVLHVHAAALLGQEGASQQLWTHPGIRVTHHGIDAAQGNVKHIAQGTLIQEVDLDMRKFLSSSANTDMNFGDKGDFAMVLRTPFGKSFADQLISRLRDIERLRSLVSMLHKRKLKCESSSLEKVVFRYNQELRATVVLGAGGNISLKFDSSNPHNRIRILLADLLNQKPSTSGASRLVTNAGLDKFAQTLLATLPLLLFFRIMEGSNSGSLYNPSIHPHSVSEFRLTYSHPPCSFDIRLKTRQDRVSWLIEDNVAKPPDARPVAERSKDFKRKDDFASMLKALFRSSGDGWRGVRSGIVADIEGVAEAVSRLHELVIGFGSEGGDTATESIAATEAANGALNGQGAASVASANSGVPRQNPPNAQRNNGRVAKGSKKQEIITID